MRVREDHQLSVPNKRPGIHSGEVRIPYLTSPLIGRDEDVRAIVAMLQSADTRLITLTGVGGVGKTRLAWEAASAFSVETGVDFRFVDLSTVRDPAGAALSVAHALGVPESGGIAIESLLADGLREWRGLLVLDNLEHLLSHATDLACKLIRECPELTIMATSRAPLHLSYEQVYLVSALSVPYDITRISAQEAMRYPAMRLFALRSQAIDPSFQVDDPNAGEVTEICHLVDGLPLAIELAAAQTRLLGPREIRDRLRRRLPSLAKGPHDAPPRQRTMADTVAWSYDLLTDDEQWLFRQLSVFNGGFTLDAAEAISASAPRSNEPLAVLTGLVGQSLVAIATNSNGETRFRMLSPVRDVAATILEAAGERDQAEERHARYVLSFVQQEEAGNIKFTPNGWSLISRLEDEHDNLKLALGWFRQQGEHHNLAMLAAALSDFWLLHGHYRVRQEWLELAEQATRDESSTLRIDVLNALAANLSWLGEYQQSIEQSERALAMARELKSAPGIRDAATRSGITAGRLGRFAQAEAYQLEALEAARQLSEHPWSAIAIGAIFGHLGSIALWKGEIDSAERHLNQALESVRRLGMEEGTTHLTACHPIGFLGDVARARGDLPRAFARYRQSLELAWHASDARAIGFGLGGVAGTLAAAGRWQEAARLFGAAEAYHEAAGIPFGKETMDRQRALGLPEPWQRAGGSFGNEEYLRQAVLALNPIHYEAIPDPHGAARHWAEGRQVSVAAAIDELRRQPFQQSEPSNGRAVGVAPLTGRETEVLRLICEGKSDQEIGEALFVTRRTAATHVSSILHKLGVNSRAVAAVWAVRNGVCR